MKQILVFVLLASTLCWLMFSPLYKHVLIVRQAVLQKEVDLLLEIGTNASHGYIDMHMIGQSKARLADMGFEPSALTYTVRTTSGAAGTDASFPLLRGEGIQLQISYPCSDLLLIDRLIGAAALHDHAFVIASGMKMSEFVP